MQINTTVRRESRYYSLFSFFFSYSRYSHYSHYSHYSRTAHARSSVVGGWLVGGRSSADGFGQGSDSTPQTAKKQPQNGKTRSVDKKY